MPTITIRFDWQQPVAPRQEHVLREMSERLQRVTAAFAQGNVYLGEHVATVDEVTIDVIIDDGHGITRADRERAVLDEAHEAKAAGIADEYHTEEA